ncbi:PTS sugar transporter subunit IIA [Gemmiger formicilis]|nr:PTS sugar transporter subunit IIA [Gemmiger formicilis]
MRIANYLRPDCVALRQRADSLTGAVQQMVTLLDGTDNLTDTAVFAADVRARLALGGVCVGNGLAIPHAKSTAVRQLQLAALTLDPPLPCDTPDGKPLDLLVMIAAPPKPTTCTYRCWPSWRRSFWTPISAPACGRVRPRGILPRHLRAGGAGRAGAAVCPV